MDIKKWFAKLEEEVSSLMSLPANEVFTDSFMIQHTRFENIQEFVNNYQFCSEENLELIDEFVIRNTDFSSWDNMNQAALDYRLNNGNSNT